MRKFRGAISYSNVVATIALFLVLSGGAAYAASTLGKNSVKAKNLAANSVTSRSIAKNAVKSKNLAANAVKAKNISKNAVKAKNLTANAVTETKIKNEAITASKVKSATLTRTNLAAGTLAGLQVAQVTSAAVPGLTTATEAGTAVPLAGTGSFTPQAGKSYELLTELKGTPTAVGGPEGESCFAEVEMFVNGAPIARASIFASATATGPFSSQPIGTSATAIGLQETGQSLNLSAISFGGTGCSAATTGTLRAVVVELG
jgi:hypothetical protein